MATKAEPKSNSVKMLEQQFANDVGKATGLDPHVVYAQAEMEGAYAPGGTGGLNFLNLKHATTVSLGKTDAGTSAAGFSQFASLQQAEAATVAEYKSKAINLYPVAPTPRGQISQIAASPWDEGHYGGEGGPHLLSTYGRLFGTKDLDKPVGGLGGFPVIPFPVGGVGGAGAGAVAGGEAGAIGSGVGAGVGSAAGKLIGGAAGAAGGIALFEYTKQYWVRGAEMLAGGVLLLAGIFLVGRAVVAPSSAATPRASTQAVAGAARRAVR